MLKIVLVDDEELIVNHLKNIIQSFDIPNKIVGTANNCQSAFSIIREKHPNLVITDIRMGDSDGLDLYRSILRVSMPNTKVIIISGFDEFNYAQRAVKYNVYSYILKPINIEELYTHLQQVHNEIVEEEAEEEQFMMIKKQLKECKPFMKGWFLKFVQDNINDMNLIDTTLNLFDINILNKTYCVFYIDFLKGEKQSQEIEKEFTNISKHVQNIYNFSAQEFKTICFYDTLSITVLISSNEKSIQTMQYKSYTLIDQIRQYLDFNSSKCFSIGVSKGFNDFSYINQAVNEAITASKYSFFIGLNGIICITDIVLKSGDSIGVDLKNIQEELLKNIRLCDKKNAFISLERFSEQILLIVDTQETVINRFLELYYFLSNTLRQEFDLNDLPSTATINEIDNCNNIDDMKRIFINCLNGFIHNIESLRTNKSKILIDKAKRFILNNYSHDISLESIAYNVGLSTCYLSTLFKKLEKTSLKEYIIDVRIERSKEFLQNIDLKIYEVALNVGYADSRYFSQLFKKKTGYTPGQYREFITK